MKSRASLLLCLALHAGSFAQLAGCRSGPEKYPLVTAAAERNYAAGRYRASGDHWLKAAEHAPSKKLRQEALYRAAASYRRAGAFSQAEKLLEVLKKDNSSERSARAAYDLALLRIKRGDEASGYQGLLAIIDRSPSSVFAERAFLRYFRHLRGTDGEERGLAWLEDQYRKGRTGELGELIGHTFAKQLYGAGRVTEARDVWLTLAKLFRYPKGALWDDALFRAAQAESDLGRPRQAIRHLGAILQEREVAHLNGSYERARYADARFRIAEIYRDDLGQPQKARATFREVFEEHPTSLLRDDALWQEALVGARLGDHDATCSPLQLLTDEFPESRFSPCAHKLCTRLTPSATQCRRYISRTLPDGTTAGATNTHSSK